MTDTDLGPYCEKAIERGSHHAQQIHPSSVVTAAWVHWKCQFGCPHHGSSYCCPPHTPTPEETQKVIDCYNRAILFHREFHATPDMLKELQAYTDMLTVFEGEMFKDGFYKSIVMLAGPCQLCKECSASKQEPCKFGDKSRPSMEGCGIDVFQTARNNGFSINTLKEMSEIKNIFCLMLVD